MADDLTAERLEGLRELARRPSMGGSLAAWCECSPEGEIGPIRLRKWQRKLCARLQDFSRRSLAGESPRLNVSAPTQEGKTAVFLRWLIWHMANFNESVGFASYSTNFAVSKSVMARDYARSPEAAKVWPHLAGPKKDERDERGAPVQDLDENWSIPCRKEGQSNPRFHAAGVGGGLSGHTMALVVIDDAFKGPADYGSKVRRDVVREWIKLVVLSRVRARRGGIANIGSRYGVDDAHGMLEQMAADGGHALERLNFPVRAKAGDPGGRAPGEYISDLWDDAYHAAVRAEMGSRQAATQLDGEPTPDEGALWKRAWMGHTFTGSSDVVATLCELTMFTLDGAETAGDGDWSVLTWWGARGGKALKLRQWRQQMEIPDLVALVRRLIIALKPNGTLVEKKSSGVTVYQTLSRELPGIIPWPVPTSKGVRYRAVLPMWEAGSVLLPTEEPWVAEYVERVLVVTGEGDEVDDEADADTIFLAWWHAGGQGATLDDLHDILRQRRR